MILQVFILATIIPLSLGDCELPNMSIGHFNITSERQLKDIIKKESAFLLGITRSQCEDCCESETLYRQLLDYLKSFRPRVPLLRIDFDKNPFISKYALDTNDIPCIYGVRKGSFFKYYDVKDALKIVRFVNRLVDPVYYMNKFEEILDFYKAPEGNFNSLKILALLYDPDIKYDFDITAGKFSNWFSTDIRAVNNKDLIKNLKELKPEISSLNSLILWRTDERKILDLSSAENIDKWIMDNSVGLVEEITPYNFVMYQSSTTPMLILFIDPQNYYSQDYIETFRKSSRKFQGRVKFVWLDGTTNDNKGKKRQLGLVTEILPAVAFNSKNFVTYPFPEGDDFNEKNLDSFVLDYIDRVKPKYNSVYTPLEVSIPNCEQIVESAEFEEKILSEDIDSLVFVYSTQNHRNSSKAAAHIDRVCRRFNELGFPHLKFFAIDIATQPPHISLETSQLPVVFMSPAYRKKSKLKKYTGEFNALDIMKFAEKNAGINFSLPEFPHLSPEEVQEYQKLKEFNKDL